MDQTENSIIFDLMCRMDMLMLSFTEPEYCSSDDWYPVTKEGREIFALLTAPEHRAALRDWYDVRFELNPSAAQLKRILEKLTHDTF